MHHMADIDVQRLDWRQALVVFEQLRTLAPDDELARTNLIELNVRLGNDGKALAELDNYSSYLVSNAREAHAVTYMAKLVEENPNYVFARGRLAEQYQQGGQIDKAVEQWDQVGEMLLDAGDVEGAKSAVRSIVALNPASVDKYQKLLQQLG